MDGGKSMKVCSNCGQQNIDASKFCVKCGNTLTNVSASAGNFNQQMPNANQQVSSQQMPSANRQTAAAQAPQKPPKKSNVGIIIGIIILIFVLVAAGASVGLIYCYNNELLFFASTDIEKDDDKDDKSSSDKKKDKDKDEDDENEKKTKSPKKTKKPSPSPSPSATPKVEVDKTKPIKASARATVSSEKTGGLNGVACLTDGDADTSWAEGVAGTGVGEYVTYKLDKKQKVYGVAIMAGCMKGSMSYNENSVPTRIKVKSGTTEYSLDIMGYHPDFTNINNSFLYVDFPKELETDEITVTIEASNLGTKTDETHISEMYMYTYPQKGQEGQYSAAAWNTKHVAGAEGYILPESNTRYLTMQDLAGLTADQCRLARNELYARYGRMFDDEVLQTYFNSCSWYRGTIPAAQFNDDVLNEYEKANRDLIVQFEQQQGYR